MCALGEVVTATTVNVRTEPSSLPEGVANVPPGISIRSNNSLTVAVTTCMHGMIAEKVYLCACALASEIEAPILVEPPRKRDGAGFLNVVAIWAVPLLLLMGDEKMVKWQHLVMKFADKEI